MVGCGVRARVPVPEQSGDGFAGPARPVADEPHQRVVTVGSLPGRGGILLVGVGDDQDTVQVHDHLPADVRCPIASQHPGTSAHFRSRGADSGQCFLACGGKDVDQAGDRRGRRRPGPNTAGSARSIAMSARRSPPSATANARSTSILPGSRRACGFHQGRVLRIWPGRGRSYGPFQPAGPNRPARPRPGRHPGQRHGDRTR